MWIWIFLLSAPFAIEGKKACPGGTFTCPDLSTCCQTLDKSYGCCPLKDAVCCDDHIHCCPTGHKCSAGMCVQSTNSSTAPTLVVNDDVICRNTTVTCPEDTTCCKDPNSSQYNCCPMENAVCCDDGSHCCPGGTTCDLEEQKCDGDGFITKLYASHEKYMKFGKSLSPKRMAKLRVGSKRVSSIVCPGGGFQCPDGNTCCKLPSGNWGCCPFPKGYCCKDGIHCCPEGMHCDATSQFCSQGPNNITSLRSKPALKIEIGIDCPDKKTCQDFETCCRIGDETYGCCPYANATCCSDLKHCCPSGSDCDDIGRRCVPKKNWVLNVLNKFGL